MMKDSYDWIAGKCKTVPIKTDDEFWARSATRRLMTRLDKLRRLYKAMRKQKKVIPEFDLQDAILFNVRKIVK